MNTTTAVNIAQASCQLSSYVHMHIAYFVGGIWVIFYFTK